MNKINTQIIVVGAGHAGCEAAAVVKRLGLDVVLVTLKLEHVAALSCNPAVGGLGKGHLVREIDAMGGLMGKAADLSTIQFRRLNTRRGLAVQASRAQVDINLYPQNMRTLVEQSGVTLVEGEAAELLFDNGNLVGVTLTDGQQIYGEKIILTTGTFLYGLMFIGEETVEGGRRGDSSAKSLSVSLKNAGIKLQRLKTGTTPRLDANTIDWSKTSKQEDTWPEGKFSFAPKNNVLEQMDCYLTSTNDYVHTIIRGSLDRSPLFMGVIKGVGPRYCPSIEDKVVRFPQKDKHLIFLEPEGLTSNRIYVNGLPTSLPKDTQEKMVAQIPGLEKAKILVYGYAVEYDFVDPLDLGPDLQHKSLKGLYFAGQVCGTSGYEEAAAQGLIAGINAAFSILDKPLFKLERHEAYIGVLIDDLTTKGVGGEPYRMFTSRAEFRLSLREDNADRRLMPLAKEMGIITDESWNRFVTKLSNIQKAKELLGNLNVKGTKQTLSEYIRRPDVDWPNLCEMYPELGVFEYEVAEQVITDIKYEGYIERDRKRALDIQKLASAIIPKSLFEKRLPGISEEIFKRLKQNQPETLAEAAKLPGITPAAIHVLTVHVMKLGKK